MSDSTPPKRAKKELKSYGRQKTGKTIKSLSLDKDLVAVGEKLAKEQGISFSQWINNLLAETTGNSGED